MLVKTLERQRKKGREMAREEMLRTIDEMRDEYADKGYDIFHDVMLVMLSELPDKWVKRFLEIAERRPWGS